jgi:uncharacterized Fe-S center protein
MSKVFFGSARARELKADSTLPAKLDRILEKLEICDQVRDKRVCIKMHLGGNLGYSTIHPLFVRRLVSFIKCAGGRPFVTDTLGGAMSAVERGYTSETIGCPILPAAGSGDKYYYPYRVDYKNLEELHIGGEIWDADYLVCLSHVKGHGNTGFGAAIKNIALGAMIGKTRSAMHMVQHAEPYWDAAKCSHFSDGCVKCVERCGVNAMRFADDQKLHVGFHECNFCKECNEVCPTDALSIRDEIAHSFQELTAMATKAVLGSFESGNAAFVNFALNVTPYCDCWGFTTANLVPDIGIFASRDIVAVERATLDSIDRRNLLPGTVPPPLVMHEQEGRHLFHCIHGKDPYVQVRVAESLGLGSSRYELEEVE